jgi:hypothetical protein
MEIATAKAAVLPQSMGRPFWLQPVAEKRRALTKRLVSKHQHYYLLASIYYCVCCSGSSCCCSKICDQHAAAVALHILLCVAVVQHAAVEAL